MIKSPDAFRTISEAAEELDIPQHVLRFWETRFPQIKPIKRGGGRRYYRPEDLDFLRGVKHFLYGEGYTIKGLQKLIKERGVRFISAFQDSDAPLHVAPVESAEPEQPSAKPAQVTVAQSAKLNRGAVQDLSAALALLAEAKNLLSYKIATH
jgi:DNA-binding transcriptional MerR regulator